MNNPHASIAVWDPLVRIFHWSLVFFFAVAFLSEDDFMTIHSYAGYGVAGLVLFRLVWGVIGTPHARFSDFVTGPSAVIAYLKALLFGRARRYIGHNPAGAAMIVLLLGSLLLTALSGMSLYATDGHGPLAGTVIAGWPAHTLEEAHEFFANLTLLLVVAHVGGVLVSSLLHRENLVRAMVTGSKPAEAGKHDSSSKPSLQE